MAVRVFTDSGADLTPSLASRLDIHIVPLTIHFGDQIYKDSVDLMPTEFFRMLKSSPVSPNTSQPSPGEFLAIYQEHSHPGDTLFSFHLSSKMSGTYQSAVLAAKQLTDRTVHVVDTASASMGIALPAICAARWAQAGVAPDEIMARCQALIASTRIYFMVDTLDYLARHGRIGKAQAWVGGLLRIKPVLCIEDGLVAPAEKVRGKTRAVSRLLDLSFQHIKPDKQYICAVMETEHSDIVSDIIGAVRRRLPEAEIFRSLLGPTIGTHTGPGALGLILSELPAGG